MAGWGGLLTLLSVLAVVGANLPSFDEDSRMRILLLPYNTRAGTTIYRVRASDPDFEHPLEFSFLSKSNPDLLTLETIPCGKQHSVCEANVILNRTVEMDQIYELSLSVRDTSGGVTTVFCTIQTTNTSAALADTFQHLNQYITVPENTPRETVVDYLIAWKNPSNIRGIRMELKNQQSVRHFRLSDKLAGTNRTNCSIVLERSLDFEVQTVHILRILALNAYVDHRVDTRNVVEVLIYVFVVDVQDTAPVFVTAPAVTVISDKLEVDKVVLRVRAEDGDKGNPREIGYALLADGSPFAPFFLMDPQSGQLKVRKSLKALNQMVRSKSPFLLTIVAEEMGSRMNESNTSTSVDLAILIEDETNDPPEFNQDRYVAHLMENAAVGTALYFGDGQNPQVTDNDQGHNGIFSLSLLGDNSTFEISPSVAENTATFTIRVKNPAMIDFERGQQIHFKVIAEEVQHSSNRVSSADVVVYVTDENDHAPVFERDGYFAEIPEHAPPGTVVVQVKASDADSGRLGSIRFTELHGSYAKAFLLDPTSGLITVVDGHSLDRETAAEITLTVEAKDIDGTGRSTTVPLVIRLLDINDNAPLFVGLPYETNLTPDLTRFTSKVIVQAVDNDTNANGAIRYEIVRGNFESKFKINELTGEVNLTSTLTSTNLPPVIQLQVRAYDLGVPHLHAETVVDIYTQEVMARSIHFIMPKRIDEEETKRIESLLTLLTGAPTTINTIQPYSEDGSAPLTMGFTEKMSDDPSSPDNQKSRLIATVRFPPHASVVDVERIQRAIVMNEFEISSGVTIEQELRGKNNILVWILAALVIVFVTVLVILTICCCCPGCYCYSDRKAKNRYAGTVRPSMMVEGRSGNGSRLTTPGRKEAWSGHKRSIRNRRQTRDRLISLSEADNNSKRPSFRSSVGNGQQPDSILYSVYDPAVRGRAYGDDNSDGDFQDIQPEDSASHQGGNTGENAFYYQRMGNADVMRLDSHNKSNNRGINALRRLSYDSDGNVRRSNSEPKLNEPDLPEGPNPSSKSMVNFPSNNNQWRLVAEPQHRTSQSKYVQSPILEETDSALERELQAGSTFYLRPKGGYLEYGRNGGDGRARHAWQRSSSVPEGGQFHHHRRNSAELRELKELERELPYFNNRSSFLRHRLSKIRKSSKNPSQQDQSGSKTSRSFHGRSSNGDGYDTESGGSSNEQRSYRNSRRNSMSSATLPASTKLLNKLILQQHGLDDDRDSGIALNNGNVNNRNRFLEKKSIFTIAYDDVATTKIPSSSDQLPS